MERYWNENMECATKDEMKALQSFRLSQTVRKVYNNVPYYRERMEKAGVTPDDIHSVEDLKKLPFTMKQDLRDTYPYGLFAVPMEDVVRVHASSGTTGKQIVVGYTQHDLDVWSECCARALTAAGATNKDFMHVSYGYGLFTGGLGLHGGAEKVGMTVIPVFYRKYQQTDKYYKRLWFYIYLLYSVICTVPCRNNGRNGHYQRRYKA